MTVLERYVLQKEPTSEKSQRIDEYSMLENLSDFKLLITTDMVETAGVEPFILI